MRRIHYFVLAILACGFFLFVSVEFVQRIDYLNSDFFTFWLGGHMVQTGQNPYFINDWIQGHNQFGATWIPNARFVYPIPLVLFFAPLGLLSLNNAIIIWIFLLEVMISISVFALIFLQKNPGRKHFIIPILAGVALFRPTFINLLGGQISGLLLFILTCFILLIEKEKWFFGSMLLPLVALKPNLGFPILIIISFWLLIQNRVKALVGIIISGLVLLLIGIIMDPYWIINYWAIGSTKMTQTFGYSSTLWGLSAYITNFNFVSTIILGGITNSILLIGVFYLVWRKRKTITPSWIVSIAITTTLLVTPYSWIYDQLLLTIPIITLTMEMMSRKYPFLITSNVFILIDIMALALQVISVQIQLEIPNVFIPLIIFCILVFCILPTKKERLFLK